MSVRLAPVLFALFAVSVCCAAGSQPVASVTSSGALVGGVNVPAGTTVFKGDTVQTQAGNTLLTFGRGDSLLLTPNSTVRLTDVASVELVKGMSRLQGRGGSLTLVASNWVVRSTPDAKTGRLTADILKDANGSVSLNVQEGELTARNSNTLAVEVASAGRPVLLPAADAPPDPQAGGQSPAPASKGGGGNKRKKVVVAAVVLTATVTAIALATRKESSKPSAAQTQQAISGLTTQATTMSSQAAGAVSAYSNLAKTNAQMASIVSQIQATQSQITQVSSQLTALQQQIGSGSPSTDQQNTLTSLSSQLTTLNTTLQNLITQGNALQQSNGLSTFKP